MSVDKKKWFLAKALIALFCLVGVLGTTVLADSEREIMQVASEGTEIWIYIKNLGTEGDLSGQIAMNEAEINDSTEVKDIHTIILLDNSLSITDENKAKIEAILKEYFQRKPADEQVSVAVFGEDVVYLTKRETDSAKLSEAITNIEYQNRDSYLTDVLYDEIEELESESQYTRFIVAADGVDNKSIGYTKEELQKKLEAKNFPVYALGCVYKENTSELENFFALSRMTSAEGFLVDDYEEYNEIVDALLADIYCVQMSVPDNCRDGSEKSILLTQNTSEGVNQFTGKATMPFQVKEEPETVSESINEVESETESESESVRESVAEETVIPEEEKQQLDYITIGALALVIVAVMILVIIQVVKKKKPKTKLPKPLKNEQSVPVPQMVQEEEDYDEGTVLIDQVRYLLVLKDRKDPKKVFKYPMLGKVTIGKSANKGAQIVLNYDSSVSGVHCAISERGGKFFVEDLNSLNGTFLNGRKVATPVECASGSELKLGNLELVIEIVAE